MKTSESFPAKWEGETIDGKYICIRERHSCLSVNMRDSEYSDPYENVELLYIEDTETYGTISYEHMKELTKDILDFSDCKIIPPLSKGEYLSLLEKTLSTAKDSAQGLQILSMDAYAFRNFNKDKQ